MSRIVSLLPAATEIAAALGLMDEVVGVSHECDFPNEANARPRVTHCPVHNAGLASKEVDEWVRRALREQGTIYAIDEPLLRELRPDVILTQKLCDVCAVGYGTVARLAETLPGPPRLVNLEPTSLSDIFEDIRHVAEACGVLERAEKVIANLSARVEAVRERAAHLADRPRCFLMEWAGIAKSVVGRDARAEKGSGFCGTELIWNGSDAARLSEHQFSIAAINGYSWNHRVLTIDNVSAPAWFAYTVFAAEETDADALTDFPFRHSAAQGFNAANYFMPGNARQF